MNNNSVAQITGNIMNYTAIIKKGEKQHISSCLELDIVSQGNSVEDALKNL